MFKFLRKYNKWILAVGGTLLMIVFLIPQAINTLSQRAAIGSAVWATVGEDRDEISAEVRRECEQELEAIDRLQRIDATLAITDRPERWYLLVREADEAGLVGGRASDLLSPQQLNNLFAVAGASQTVNEAIGKRLAVDRMFGLYLNAAKYSDNRLRHDAARLFRGVDIRTVVLEASADGDVPEPTEAEILAQFEAYRDVTPGTGERGFGYRLPNRFKVEWLTIDDADIRSMVEAGDQLNGVALFKHWERYQEARSFPPLDTASEIPDAVRNDLLKELTLALRDKIQKLAYDRLFETWRRMKAIDGYYVLSEEWADTRIDLRTLAEAIQEELPGLELPAYQAIGDRWLTVEDVADLEGLGTAGTDKFGTRWLGATDAIGAAQEFGGSPTILVQAGVTAPALFQRGGEGLVLFRITDVDPSRPPVDVDEVRDQVVTDLRRLADFQRLLAQADRFEATARENGLLALAMEHDTPVARADRVTEYNPVLLNFQIQNNMALSRMPSALPVIGEDLDTIRAIVARAMEVPADVPLADAPVDQRIFVLPVENKMALMVIEMIQQYPMSSEQYAMLTASGALQRLLIQDELSALDETLIDAFSFEALAERHGFEIKRRETAEDAEADVEVDDVASAEGS